MIIRPKPQRCILQRHLPLARGLVAAWPFDDGAGKIVRDGAGTNHGTAVTSGTWVAGPHGGTAMRFNGTTDLVVVSSAAFDRVTGDPMTVSVWLKPYALTSYHDIVANRCAAQEYTWVLVVLPSRNIQLWTASGPCTSFPTVDLNLWQHFVVTQSAAGLQALYKNGVLLGTSTGNGYKVNSPAALGIGGGNFNQNEFINADISDVRVYNRALALWEVKELYNDPYAIWRPEEMTMSAVAFLAAWWHRKRIREQRSGVR